jgi:tRNA-dihydrouridine synthase
MAPEVAKNLLLDLLEENNHLIGLSPMDGITDAVFRYIQTTVSQPDILFTEFVSAEGIAHGAVKLFDQLLYSSVERPIIAQLFGKDPQSFYFSTIILCHLGFDGVDINMGCPAKTVTQHGSGAALIGNYSLVREIISSVKKAVSDFESQKITINDLKLKKKTLEIIDRNLKYSTYKQINKKFSVSVKTRLGIENSIVDTWIPFLLEQDLDFITLHGRTLRQGYSGVADWEEIKKAANFCKKYRTKIFGNGDIQNRSQGIEYCHKYSVNGALIGRSALGNPWVFGDIIATPQERYDTLIRHTKKFLEVFPERRFEPLRKYFLAYTKGLPNAKILRSKLITVTNIDQLLSLEEHFLS